MLLIVVVAIIKTGAMYLIVVVDIKRNRSIVFRNDIHPEQAVIEIGLLFIKLKDLRSDGLIDLGKFVFLGIQICRI